jgi:sec-independent protein translocase protein TatA
MLAPMFGMGVGELLIVLVVVLLVFGPGRLPEMMGNLGKAMREFQKGLREPPEVDVPATNPTPAADAKRDEQPKLSPATSTETP